MLKGLKNTRTKQHIKQDIKQTAPQNRLQSNKEQDQHRNHRPRTASRANHRGGPKALLQPANPTPGPDLKVICIISVIN